MKKLVIVLVVALVGVSAAAGYFWKQLAAERSLNADLNDRIMGLEVAQQAAALVPRADPVVVASETSPAAAQPVPSPAAPAQARRAATDNAGAALGAMTAELLASPDGQEMLRSQLRMMLPVQYPDLGKTLGLSPAELEKFYDLLIKQQLEQASGQLALLGGGGNPSPDEIQEAQRTARAREQANAAEMSAMLGSKYPQWQEYQSTLTVRQQVSQLQASLGAAGSSLSDSQSQRLIKALAAEQTRITEESRSAPTTTGRTRQEMLEQELDRLSESNRRLVNVASAHLDPQQLDSYRKMLEQRERLQRTVIGALGQAGAGQ